MTEILKESNADAIPYKVKDIGLADDGRKAFY